MPAAYPDTIIIDQNPARGSRCSNTATYTGILDAVRKAFAKANAVEASLFSANSKGACPDCNGLGVIYTDLAHLDPMVTTCETCEGKRFLPEVLGHHLRGKSIADVYEMSVSDAAAFFTEPAIAKISGASTMWGWAISRWASRSRPCRAANASASSWRPSWAKRAISMCSTNPRRACI
ncbi:hypothetical protein N8D56_03280 [Devosia sp. A8/3-2]|nr:hypothetical protein N8D56_03280 [Devosia sp. A8/3-2]